MNTKTIVWAVIAVVVLGGVWYFALNSSGGLGGSPTATTTLPDDTSAQTTKTSGTSAALKPTATQAKIVGVGPTTHLIGLKQSLICSVTSKSGYSRTGTMYIAGGKVRANFAGTSMIDDGANLYAWTNGATTGAKVSAALSASGSVIASHGGIDLATDVSYACNPWTENASVFALPTTVAFSSLY